MGCHFLLQGIFLGIEPMAITSPSLAGEFFTTLPPGKPGLGWALYSMRDVLKEEDRQRHMMTKVETGMKVLPTKEGQGLPATPGAGETRTDTSLFPEVSPGTSSTDTSVFRCMASRPVTLGPFLWGLIPLAPRPIQCPWKVGSRRGPGAKCTLAL